VAQLRFGDYIEASDLGRPPPAAASGADPSLVGFSEQVPETQRITLSRSRPSARTGSSIQRARGHQPWRNKMGTSPRSSSTQNHPKPIDVVQFKANLLSTEAKELDAETQEAKRQKLAAQQEEERKDMDQELAVLVEIQKVLFRHKQTQGQES